jgi:hypothetical protein
MGVLVKTVGLFFLVREKLGQYMPIKFFGDSVKGFLELMDDGRIGEVIGLIGESGKGDLDGFLEERSQRNKVLENFEPGKSEEAKKPAFNMSLKKFGKKK